MGLSLAEHQTYRSNPILLGYHHLSQNTLAVQNRGSFQDVEVVVIQRLVWPGYPYACISEPSKGREEWWADSHATRTHYPPSSPSSTLFLILPLLPPFFLWFFFRSPSSILVGQAVSKYFCSCTYRGYPPQILIVRSFLHSQTWKTSSRGYISRRGKKIAPLSLSCNVVLGIFINVSLSTSFALT